MDLPPYMKLISGAVEPSRRPNAPRRPIRPSGAESSERAGQSDSKQAEVVSLITRQNLASANIPVPTLQEAQEALSRLQRGLPAMGQGVGDLHANLDRRRILVLLAPLVEG